MGHVSGSGEVLKNLKGVERLFIDALIESVEAVAIIIETFIKVHYQRPITGVGFTDRTSALRRSITHLVELDGNVIRAWIFAGAKYGQHVEAIAGGKPAKKPEEYAEHVELMEGGKYAFMLPGLLAKKPEVMGLLVKELKRRGL